MNAMIGMKLGMVLGLAGLACSGLWGCSDDDPDRSGTGGAGAGGTGGIPDPGELDLVDWTTAGYPGPIPDIDDTIIDVASAGAACDGATDDHAALQAAIDSAPNPAALVLPAGTCRIHAPLEMASGIVLRGQGSLATVLECQSQEGCIAIQGRIGGDFVAIQSGLEQGSDQLVVDDASGFAVGQGAQIQQEPIVPPDADWGDDAVGQMARIASLDGNTLTIDPPLHLDYLASHQPQIRPIDLVEEVGVEDLTLRRLDDSGSDNSNFMIRRAAASWIRRVESDFTEKYHVAISESLYIELRDSYLHHAKSKGDGGQGYGASLGRHATAVLVENNIFYETRHAMIVQIGTSGCVFGYNYAEKCYGGDDGRNKTAISLHGHYPFMNLFEGNVVGWIGVDDVWGPAGPGNTFLRNRVLGTDGYDNFGDSRGMWFDAYHGTQYAIGNEVFAEGIYGDLSDVVLHGNNVNGTVEWDPEMPDQTLPASYYLSSKPAFYGALDWPSIGGDMTPGQGSIPALERWNAGDYVPQP